MTRTLSVTAFVLGGLALFACSGSRDSGFEQSRAGNTPAGGGPGGGAFGNGSDGGEGQGTPGKPCIPDPANYDVPGNNCDDDGDGTIDNPPACDANLDVSGNAEDFAKAIGVCTKANEKGYGLVSASFTRGYQRTDAPQAEQHGILPKFGNVIKPREGASLAVLSTGYAREYDGPGKEPFGGATSQGAFSPLKFNGKSWAADGAAPPGFPKGANGCPQSPDVKDVIVAKLEIKAPPNVSGIKFDFNFYSGEWPAYICSAFNDGFIAYLTAKGFNNGKGDNVSFDKDQNPVSVNNGFFDRCTPNFQTGCAPDAQKKATAACPGGTSELAGTGFGIEGDWCGVYSPLPGLGGNTGKSVNGGSTGWLTSSAPVTPGETFTIEFYIWDAGDNVLDSSVLIDNFTWLDGTVATGTERPPK